MLQEPLDSYIHTEYGVCTEEAMKRGDPQSKIETFAGLLISRHHRSLESHCSGLQSTLCGHSLSWYTVSFITLGS